MPSDVGIWDLAISINTQALLAGEGDSTNKPKERSLVMLGSKGVGKTSLIHRFLERDEAAKQTLALEYTFGRKTNQNLVKVNIQYFSVDIRYFVMPCFHARTCVTCGSWAAARCTPT